MNVSLEDIEAALLRSLTGPGTDHRFCFLHERVQEQMPHLSLHASRYKIMEAVWSLVAKRLIYVDYSQSASSNWKILLTERGREAAGDLTLNPDNVPAYLRRVVSDIPALTVIPRFYLDEALRAYSNECYTASTMMLGVAAEAAFYDMAASFAAWLNNSAGSALANVLAKPTTAYIQKFVEFQKRLAANKGHLPAHLQQNLDLNINSVLELLRLARNDVGHPTGVQIDRHDAFQHLVIFPGLARRLYDLKAYFESSSLPAGA